MSMHECVCNFNIRGPLWSGLTGPRNLVSGNSILWQAGQSRPGHLIGLFCSNLSDSESLREAGGLRPSGRNDS